MKKISTEYELTYNLNNGTSWPEKPYFYTCYRTAIEAGKKMVQGGHFYQEGNKSTVTVINVKTGATVYEGVLLGRRQRFINFTQAEE